MSLSHQNLKIAILGASRGLGLSLTRGLLKQNNIQLFLSSRKVMTIDAPVRAHDTLLAADFSKVQEQDLVLQKLQIFSPHIIFYVAGGGPFGPYEDKKWFDHEWAFEVTFKFAARTLHAGLAWPELKQMIVVGSEVAESKPDAGAASYAAAKHALRGLISTLQIEQKNLKNPKDIRLFSAPYMLTDMLPANAWPRQQGLAKDPDAVALLLWQYSQSPLI